MEGAETTQYALITQNGQPKGTYTPDQLTAMWSKGEIGPRTPLRNLQTNQDLYLDQLVAEPIQPYQRPTQSNRAKVIEALKTNYQIFDLYAKDNKGLTPPSHGFLPPTLFTTYQAGGQTYQHHVQTQSFEYNLELSNQPFEPIKAKATSWLMVPNGDWYDNKMPVLTADGKVHVVNAAKFRMEYRFQMRGDISELLKESSPP